MKIYSFISKLCMLCFIILMASCGADSKEKPKTDTTTTTTETEKAVETPKEDNTYYIWVDNINVRDASNTKGKVIGTYKPQEIEFTGTTSENKDIIVLRGVVYDSYWFRVTTNDNKEGWVYGGAVKEEGADAGNEIITNEKFDFPHFGKFDLTTWKNIDVKNEEAGDAETRTTTYFKDGQTLEVSKTDVGEYGYYHKHVLKNSKKEILKERDFGFTVDVGENERIMELIEIVKDHTKKVKYTRSQKTSKHFMQMNDKPQMVNGTWESVTLKSDE